MCMPVKWDTCWDIVHWTGLCKKAFKCHALGCTPSRSGSTLRKGKRRQQEELDFGCRCYIFLFKTLFFFFFLQRKTCCLVGCRWHVNSLCSLGVSSTGASGDTKPTDQQASAAPGVNSRVTSVDSKGKGLHEAVQLPQRAGGSEDEKLSYGQSSSRLHPEQVRPVSCLWLLLSELCAKENVTSRRNVMF